MNKQYYARHFLRLKQLARHRQLRRQSLLWLLAIGIASATLASISVPTDSTESQLTAGGTTAVGSSVLVITHPDGTKTEHRLNAGLPQASGIIEQLNTAPVQQKLIVIRRNDTLIKALRRHGMRGSDIAAIAALREKRFRRLRPGQRLLADFDHEHKLQRLAYSLSVDRQLVISSNNGKLESRTEHIELERRSTYARGTIEDSLYQSSQRAGLNDRQIAQLVDMFGWDIDFALDVRKGDHFSAVYETLYRDGMAVGKGNVVAAEYINRGKSYRAIAFKDVSGQTQYFSPDGQSLRRSFLRSPVKFSRISSRFTRKRYHPVLKRWRAHKGVDYAAPTGTPIRTTAAGTVIFAGRKGGYGNTVIIRHGGQFSTLYAHMSRIYRGIRKGVTVKQGQSIGRVGKTGLASGPHLHYEFRVNDSHRNPLTYRFPASDPIDPSLRDAFLAEAEQRIAQLEALVGTTRVAEAQ